MTFAISKYAHHVLNIFDKRMEKLHGGYWNIDLVVYFYDTTNILLSLNLMKINNSIFSILNNRYLRSMKMSNYIRTWNATTYH